VESCVGRTLLSDAFDVVFDFGERRTINSQGNIRPNPNSRASDRSVRPTHTTYCTVTATLAVWDNEPLVAVTVMP
jgi:hypothetical protein